MITFYDFHSTAPTTAWSPVSWKIRYILNYKKLPYKTVFLEYPDIEETCKKMGIAPTGTKPDRSGPLYTLPAIYDSSTGKGLADSLPIAQYLDTTYPDTPAVVRKGTEVLTLAYASNFFAKFGPLYMCLLKDIDAIMSRPSAAYLSKRTFFGKSYAELMVVSKEEEKEGLKKVKEALAVVDDWVKTAGLEGSFIMGEKPMYVDFAVAALFMFVQVVADDDIWKEISTWQGGRWRKFMDELKEWEAVV